MDIVLKKASPEDAKTISKIHRGSWKTAYRGMVPDIYLDELKEDHWVSFFQERCKEGSIEATILYEHNIPVGVIAFGKGREKGFENWGEIVSLYVLPEYIRKGYGKHLIEEALQYFREKNLENCYLWVLRENINAQKFYRQCGFEKTEDTFITEIAGKTLIDNRYRRQV